MAAAMDPYKGLAQIYEEIRPSYPGQLVEDVVRKTGLRPEARLLEIGAGTGKATVQFARKGFHIHAIELGEDMARILLKKCSGDPHVSLDIIPFEEWDITGQQPFDLVYCAQAFHWLEAKTKYEKCHRLLQDDGWLALFWYHQSSEEVPETALVEERISRILERHASRGVPKGRLAQRYNYREDPRRDGKRMEIEASGLFDFTEKVTYTDEARYTPAQYLKVKKSIPAFTAILNSLDDPLVEQVEREIEEAILAQGGEVRIRYVFSLYLAKKRT